MGLNYSCSGRLILCHLFPFPLNHVYQVSLENGLQSLPSCLPHGQPPSWVPRAAPDSLARQPGLMQCPHESACNPCAHHLPPPRHPWCLCSAWCPAWSTWTPVSGNLVPPPASNRKQNRTHITPRPQPPSPHTSGLLPYFLLPGFASFLAWSCPTKPNSNPALWLQVVQSMNSHP